MTFWSAGVNVLPAGIDGTRNNHKNKPFQVTESNGQKMVKSLHLNPTRRIRNRTLNIRVTDEEIAMARQLGNGNASHGYRLAIRYMSERSISGIPLSTMLRAAAEMAAELERSPKRGAPPTTR
jgi:hypothetical protein